ncbi:MAG TPA: glycerol-3-phosphate 1-O-acyltransferase PlsY [Verrucomicrobiae bacterium]|nr:glycerol-3-phosphate 1-O-acyltransferase PlsY [Verrucomicrobiae bacterium]
MVIPYIIVALAAYLLGSIPTGFLVARAKGIDIQKVGSGNIGATNSMRVLGKPAGIFVLVMDLLKGFAAVAWLTVLVLKIFNGTTTDLETLKIVAGIFVVLGHNYPCWLKFKGGKGIATTAGVYLALAPLALGIALVVFILTVLLTRFVSLGSIVAAVALPIAVWFTRDNLTLRMMTIALGAMAIFKHRKNMQRIMAGTENRLGKKSSTEAAK